MKFEELKFDKEQYNIMKTAEEYKQELSNLHYDIQSTIDAICMRNDNPVSSNRRRRDYCLLRALRII